jgi:phosphotransferase system IIA component
MVRKAAPVAVCFAIIAVIGVVSKSIYFHSLPLAVTTDIVTNSPLRYEYTATGTVQKIKPRKETVPMPFTGEITHLYVAVGQEVKTGDLLFSIDVSNLMAEIGQIETLVEERMQRMAQASDPIAKDQLSGQTELLLNQLREKKECLTHDVVFSPFDGTVSKVNRANGDVAGAASAVIEMIVHPAAWEISLYFPSNNRAFEVGETIALKNSGNQDCAGTIRNISFSNGQKHIEAELDPRGLYEGEQLWFSDSVTTESVAYAIKTNTIRKDNDGYYILQLAKERTSLGEKTFAKRVNIDIGVTVGEYTEVVDGIVFIYPVISNPDIRDGMEVRMY